MLSLPLTPLCVNEGSELTDPLSLCSVFVKAWNLSTWPAYKSRLWNKQEPQPTSSSAVHHRNPYVLCLPI